METIMYTDDLQNQSQSDSNRDNLFPEDSLKNKNAEQEARHADTRSLRICYNSSPNADENIANPEIINNNFFQEVVVSEEFFKYQTEENKDEKSSSQNVISDARLESENAELVTRHFQDGHLLCGNNQIIANPDKNNKLFSPDLLIMNQNFFKIPRSITRHTAWNSFSWVHKVIFITILDYLSFKDCEQDDHGKIIKIKPGQLLASHETIAKWVGCKTKDVENFLNRSLTTHFLGQELGYRKTLISLKDPYLSELYKTSIGAGIGVRLGQDWGRKEEIQDIQEIKENNKDIVAAEAAPSDVGAIAPPSLSSFSNQERAKKQRTKSLDDKHNINNQTQNETKKELKHKNKTKKQLPSPEKHLADGKILHGDKVFLLPIEYQKLKEKHGEQKLNEMIQILDSYKFSSGKEYDSDYGVMKEGGWVLKEWKKNQNENTHSQSLSSDESNKKFALDLLNNWKSEHYKIEILSKCIEFSSKGGAYGNVEMISWSEKGFKEQVESILRKRNFRRNTQANNMSV